ncbi:gasdermin-C [Dama dama]
MTSLFEHTNKNLVKELGGKDLKPIQNPQSANKFCLLSLLWQKRRILSQFWKQPDVPGDCILMDILEPSSSVPEPVVTGKFLFSDKMVQTEAAEVDVTAGLEVSASGKASQSYECSLEVQSVTISPRDWEDLQERKVLDQEPPFLKECRTRGDNLYVVTEVVQLINTTVLQDSSSVNGTGKLSIPWSFCVKSTGDRSGLKVRQRTLTLPQGTVMAYKRKQLVFQENGRAILISHDDKRKTFPEDEFLCCAGSLPRPQFQGYSSPTRHSVLQGILLQQVLSDIQHELLAWSMEKRILPQQQELVKSILEPNFLHPCNNPFTLDPKLLASLEEEGLAVTFGLLQECGLSVAPDNPKGTWDLEAKEPLSALYGSLLMLQQLAEA